MPHSLSAKKRLRQDAKRFVDNRGQKREIKTRSKRFAEAITAGELDEAKKLMAIVIENIDKAQKKNILHKNKAARLKSRLALALNAATATAAAGAKG